MRLSYHVLYEPGDEQNGGWSREQLIEMNAAFTAALERAFELGLERKESAASQIQLKPTLGPRFVPPPLPDGLWRSASGGEPVFVARS